jgi:hypothetical protein
MMPRSITTPTIMTKSVPAMTASTKEPVWA